ncbi:MAG: winged helix-turn-helix domain-containing protein [Promethearchaeota archaeon]
MRNISNPKNSPNSKDIPNEAEAESTLNFGDVMRSKPKFLIFFLLSMSAKLTLKGLSEITGKSKSTLSNHLTEMQAMGLVEVAGEKKARGSIPTKYFRLVSNYEEKMAQKCCKKSEDNIAGIKQTFQMQRSFAQTQVQMLQKWLLYLDLLENDFDDEIANGTSNSDVPSLEEIKSDSRLDEDDKVEKGNSGPALQEIKKIIHDMTKITIVSFYDKKNAKKFRDEVLTIYNEAEERHRIADDPDLVHPYYVGVQILPIKSAIDYSLANDRKKKEEIEKKKKIEKQKE